MRSLDFEAIFDASPNPYMLVDSELRYVAANRAYLQGHGEAARGAPRATPDGRLPA